MSLILLVAALTVFLGSQIQALRAAPPLELFSPPLGLTTAESAVEIEGKTSPGAYLEVNGAPLLLSVNGSFKHMLVLRTGVNTITITARRRYSRPAVLERQVLILESQPLTRK